jgi:dihydroneopterin aldolase
MNLTQIIVRDFKISAYIGIYPEEHDAKQNICINVTIELTDYKIQHDNIEDTVSYESIVNEIRKQSELHFNLVETLAEELAKFCLTDKRVDSVTIQIEKNEVFKPSWSSTSSQQETSDLLHEAIRFDGFVNNNISR